MARKFIYAIVSILLFIPALHSDIIVLTSGERLQVTIVAHSESSVEVHHKILGDFVIQTSSIASIEPSPEEKVAGETIEDPQDEDGEEPSTWNQEVRLGLGYQKGQKESSDVSVSYHADRTKNEYKVTFDVHYRLAESDAEKTLNRFSAIFGNTWLQANSRWDTFANLQFDWENLP